MCEVGVDPNCGHFGCWGLGSGGTCPGAAIERAKLNAWRSGRRAKALAGVTV
jgi:hypothetical protein